MRGHACGRQTVFVFKMGEQERTDPMRPIDGAVQASDNGLVAESEEIGGVCCRVRECEVAVNLIPYVDVFGEAGLHTVLRRSGQHRRGIVVETGTTVRSRIKI